jgi:beta-N-acetylhexosaminidase
MKKYLYPLLLLVPLLFIISCTAERETMRESGTPMVFRSSQALAVFMNSPNNWVDRTMERLSLEEKIAQMVVPRMTTFYVSSDTDIYREWVRYVETLKVGGLIFARGDVSEMALLANDMQSRAEIPLLISADFEWGTAMRVRRGTLFPVAMAIGATRDPDLAFRTGRAIAREARALGVHQNFGPVADVNTNPDNPVINVRAFGEDTLLVMHMANAYTQGLHAGGVISTAKHFPGHGDTNIDSHLALPVLTYDNDRLQSVELAPFRYIVDRGVMSIMSAHIAVPALGEDQARPATLSHKIMHELLRNEIGFSGLVVTDALEMRSISRNYTVEESAVMAVEAGADMILLSPDIDEAMQSLLAAVQSGRISRDRIDRSVRRILMMKYWLGLHKNRIVPVPEYRSVVGNVEHRELAAEIAREAMTLVRNNDEVLPLNDDADKIVLAIIIADRQGQRVAVTRPSSSATDEPAGVYFVQNLRARYKNVEVVRLDPRTNRIEYDSLFTKAARSDYIVGAAYVQARSHQGDIRIPDEMREALVALSREDRPFVLISFGDPYFIRNVPEVDAYLCAYSSAEASVEAAVETILGYNNPKGKLPVTIPGIASYGAGLEYTVVKQPDEDIEIPEEEVPEIDID